MNPTPLLFPLIRNSSRPRATTPILSAIPQIRSSHSSTAHMDQLSPCNSILRECLPLCKPSPPAPLVQCSVYLGVPLPYLVVSFGGSKPFINPCCWAAFRLPPLRAPTLFGMKKKKRNDSGPRRQPPARLKPLAARTGSQCLKRAAISGT